MHNRLLLSRLAAVLVAAAVFLSGCDQYMLPSSQMDGAVTTESREVTKADRSGYTVAMVEKALQRYDAEGREATVDYYNSPESVDGEWYVFITDENDEIIAHANPDLLGESLHGPVGVDITGYRQGEAIASATEEGKWVDYIFLNLATGNQEFKHTWAVRRDGLIFASGWYQILPDLSRSTPTKADRPGYAAHLVEQAIQRYKTEGREATLEYINSPANLDGEWYVFLIDEDDILIGHPREELRGQYSIGDEIGELGVDITGYRYGELLHSVDEEGLWVDYFFLNIATGNHEYKHTWVVRHDGLIFGSGWYQVLPGLELGAAKAHPVAYTVAMVERALQRYEAQGRDATVDYYNTPESADGEYYVFIFDESDQLIAHANPDLLGMDLKGDLGVDVTGYRFGDLMLSATEEGLWVDYLFQNLATGNQEYKHSWVVKRDGLLFGSGWYQVLPSTEFSATKAHPVAYTVDMVEQALQRYEAEGRDATVDYYNTPESADGEYYVFIFDENDQLIAHANPDLLGMDLKEELGVDVTGYRFGDLMLSATEEGLWVDYLFQNLATGNQEYKHSWVVRRDGLLFGSGWYQVLPSTEVGATKAHPVAYTVDMVEQALQRYEAEGRDATVDYYNTPESADGEYYVFIFDENDQLIAHANPDLLGMDLKEELGVDVTGYRFGDLMLSATEEGLWVDYLFQNLATGNQEYKHSWVVRRDGLLFGSGWYQVLPTLPTAVTKARPAEYTVAMVDRALRYYKAYGREETVAYYNTPESVDGEYYVYIFDESDLLIAHANPDLLGMDLKEELGLDSTGYHFGTDMLETTAEGLWVHYVFVNPATGEEETKHAWAVRHDGLIIGSGWYE